MTLLFDPEHNLEERDPGGAVRELRADDAARMPRSLGGGRKADTRGPPLTHRSYSRISPCGLHPSYGSVSQRAAPWRILAAWIPNLPTTSL